MMVQIPFAPLYAAMVVTALLFIAGGVHLVCRAMDRRKAPRFPSYPWLGGV